MKKIWILTFLTFFTLTGTGSGTASAQAQSKPFNHQVRCTFAEGGSISAYYNGASGAKIADGLVLFKMPGQKFEHAFQGVSIQERPWEGKLRIGLTGFSRQKIKAVMDFYIFDQYSEGEIFIDEKAQENVECYVARTNLQTVEIDYHVATPTHNPSTIPDRLPTEDEIKLDLVEKVQAKCKSGKVHTKKEPAIEKTTTGCTWAGCGYHIKATQKYRCFK